MNTVILSLVTFLYLSGFVFLLIHSLSKNHRWAVCGKAIAIGTLCLHTIGILFRWIESYHLGIGHAPLSNLYESLVFFSWTIMGITVIIGHKYRRNQLWVFGIIASSLLMAYASFSPNIETQIQPLIPALKSNWLITHVITCFLGYAAFVITSFSGIIYLFQIRNHEDTSKIESLHYQCLCLGFILFTIGIMTGSVWAHVAWGKYWGWDPKETWALITWLIYTAMLHERIRKGGVWVAVLSILGLASVLFTYFGVNYLPGLHSYL